MTDTEREQLLELAKLLHRIKDNDLNYQVRYGLVLDAIALAHRMGYAAGFRVDPAAPEWPIAYIELPTGQVSWHMPQHQHAWDGHSTEEKYRRLWSYVLRVSAATSRPKPSQVDTGAKETV